jgi:replicative DNA helicase
MMTELVQWASDIQSHPGIKFGIPAMDHVVIPMRPGNLVSLIARPGHAKTSVLVYLARQEAKAIVERGAAGKEVVVYTTWEQTSEELTAMLMADPEINFSDISWGRADLEKLKAKAIKGVHNPIWIIGHGISKASSSVPRMTPELVLSSIECMQEDHGVKPSLMLFDYLQLIPTSTPKDRVQQVTEMPILLKELAMRVGAPAVAAVQAARAVDNREEPIPQEQDAQWASSIEQTCDKIFGLWRPIKTHDTDQVIELGNMQYEVNENLLIIRMLKQRGERGRHTWGMYFDPALIKLAELETDVDSKPEYPLDF